MANSKHWTTKKMSNKIVFFGNERLGTGLGTNVPVLQSLIAEGYEITAVVVAQNENGKSRKSRVLEIVQVAEANNIPVLSPANLLDISSQLKSYGAKAGVLIAYGKMIPKSIIQLFPRGIINIHPSLLPQHRGPIPIEGVILKGEKETGVSLMQLVDKMDSGPIYAQKKLALKGDEYKGELASKLISLGAEMLVENLPNILNGTLEAVKQNDVLATYDNLIEKKDGELDFKKSAEELTREVRAYEGWPRSQATIGTARITVTKAHVANVDGTPGTLYLDENNLGIHCQTGTLIIDRLIPDGKKEMSAKDFLLGYSP